MSSALSAGVSGIGAYQKMLDIAGNNLANANTVGFKSSRVVFSQLLSETIKRASLPTAAIGGTNPQQIGSGVSIGSITAPATQGNITNTGRELDLALEGAGYFVLNDGSKDIYTRAGAFAVDANSTLVDPATGYRVQRIGAVGESDGFQTPGNANINIPYDVAIEAKATSQIGLSGNLSATDTLDTAQTNVLASNVTYTTSNGTTASGTTELDQLDQFSGTFGAATTITFSGYKPDGTALSSASPSVDLSMPVTATTTLNDVLAWLNTDEGTAAVNEIQTVSITGAPTGGTFTLTYGDQTTAAIPYNATAAQVDSALEALSNIGAGDVTCADGALPGTAVTVEFTGALAGQDVAMMTIDDALLTGGASPTGSVAETTKGRAVQGVLGSEATASLVSGRITITDVASGYSHSDLAMAWADNGSATLTMPGYFEISTVGGEEVKKASAVIYDSLGGKHVITTALVRTDTANTWDMVLTSIGGNIYSITNANRRINGIEFDGADASFAGLSSPTEPQEFQMTFSHDTANPQIVAVDLGTVGRFDGLTQFASRSTAVVGEQDGYSSGNISTVSISNGGVVVGSFSNGIKRDLATIQIATFRNPAGLENVGRGYLGSSVNSGDAVATEAMVGVAGTIHSASLEGSNVDIASLFAGMIEAQNGYTANARTIKMANEMLRTLTDLMR